MPTDFRFSIAELKRMWAELLPDAAPPEDFQFALWLNLHGIETMREGLRQLATKFRKMRGAMDTTYRIKFLSAVANRLDQTGIYARR